jgi:hypothetical protein
MSPVMANVSVRVFILCLSATDLIACVAGIPFEIVDIRFKYTFSSVGACKFLLPVNILKNYIHNYYNKNVDIKFSAHDVFLE